MSARSAGPLEYEISGPPPGPGMTVAVLLHGRGADRHDLQGLRPMLPPDWLLVTPEAPHAAAEWGHGPGSAWYRYLADDRVVEETLAASLERLGALLEALPGVLGLEPARMLLGGFSQGGTTSLAYALSHPGAAAAVLDFSGFLAASVELDETGAAPPTTPIFWGHGVADAMIPLALAEKGRARLWRAGAKLEARDYPIGHWIAPEEVRDAVAMVESAAPVS